MIRKGNHNKNKGSKQQLGFRVEGLGSKQQCSAKQNTKKQALSNSDSQTKKKNRLSETMIRPRKMRVWKPPWNIQGKRESELLFIEY